jgi:hypothetical protein
VQILQSRNNNLEGSPQNPNRLPAMKHFSKEKLKTRNTLADYNKGS